MVVSAVEIQKKMNESSSLDEIRSNKELFEISKIVYNEAFMEGYLEQAGPQRDKFIKEIEENKNSIKTYAVFGKFMSGMIILLMDFLMTLFISSLSKNLYLVNKINFPVYLYTTASVISIALLIKMVFLSTFGMMTLSGIFMGKSYRILEILPLERKEIRKIVFFTFFRAIDTTIICMLIGLPLVTAIYTGSFIATLGAIIVSFINLVFCLSIMIMLANFMARKVFNPEAPTKGKTILKVIAMIGYMLGMMFPFLIMTFMNEMAGNIFSQGQMMGDSIIQMNWGLGFILFPLTLAYIYGIFIFPFDTISFTQIWPILIAFTILVIIVIFLSKKAMNILQNTAKEEEATFQKNKSKKTKEKMNIEVKINSTNPVNAIIKKDFKVLSRNFSMLTYLMIPFLYDLIGTYTVFLDSYDPYEAIISNASMITLYTFISPIFLMIAVTSLEKETGNLLYTLPIEFADVHKAKRRIMQSVMLLALIPPLSILIVLFPGELLEIAKNFGLIILSTIAVVDVIIVLYARLFGKVKKDQYLLMMLNPRRKTEKIVLIVIAMAAVVFLPWLIGLPFNKWVFYISRDDVVTYVNYIVAVIILVGTTYATRKTFYKK